MEFRFSHVINYTTGRKMPNWIKRYYLFRSKSSHIYSNLLVCMFKPVIWNIQDLSCLSFELNYCILTTTFKNSFFKINERYPFGKSNHLSTALFSALLISSSVQFLLSSLHLRMKCSTGKSAGCQTEDDVVLLVSRNRENRVAVKASMHGVVEWHRVLNGH